VPSVSKPFQKFYQKARESRFGLLDEKLVVESMAAMKPPVSFSAEEVAAVLAELNPIGGADFVKGCVKPSSSMKGCLQRGFLDPSPAVKASSIHTSILKTVVSSSTSKVKEVGVVGFPSSLGGCVTPIVGKDGDSRVNGLSQSQKWPVGFGPSGEVVV